MFSPLIAGMVGGLAAAFAHYLAAMISGAGHAWVEPFFFSAALWVFLPLTFVRLEERRGGSEDLAFLDAPVLASGLLLDALLVLATVGKSEWTLGMFGTGTERFLRVVQMDPPLVSLWITLWLSWQLAALYLVLTRRPRRGTE